MMRHSFILFTLLSVIACVSDKNQKSDADSGKPVVVAVNYPLHYFAERLAGDIIRLEYLVPQDVDPAYWMPDDEALTVIQDADIILDNGAGYAKWMNHVSLSARRVVNTTGTVKEKYIELKQVQSHSHGSDGKHEHSGYACTTWLDFEIAVIQAESVNEALQIILPERKEEIEIHFTELRSDLLSLHRQMQKTADQIREQNLVASHPVYQYLAEGYNLKIHSVHFEPDEIPTEDQLNELSLIIEQSPSQIMLWEDEPIPEIAAFIEKMGLTIIVFNPCGNQIETYNFLEVMQMNINNLQNFLQSAREQ